MSTLILNFIVTVKITFAKIDGRSGEVRTQMFDLPVGTTLREALALAGLPIDAENVGIFCRKVPLETVLTEGTRIDIGTPLRVERAEARRLREANAKMTRPLILSRHGSKRQLQHTAF